MVKIAKNIHNRIGSKRIFLCFCKRHPALSLPFKEEEKCVYLFPFFMLRLFFEILQKILHTGDTDSLDVCGY